VICIVRQKTPAAIEKLNTPGINTFMQSTIKKNVEEVAKHHLCLCCGTCTAVCPKNAVSLIETIHGMLIPKVDETLCSSCGLCLKVCPGTHLEKGLLPPQTDPFKGSIISAYCGQAVDKEILRNGQSGGVVTALLEHLLDSGRINNALVTQMPRDGSLRPKCVVTCDRDVIRKSQASKYCPAPVGAAARKAIVRDGEKLAVVGVACHMHGLTNAQALLGGPEPLRIGLVCDRMMTFGAIDHLIDIAGANRGDVASVQFRSKKFNGWPGDVCVCMKDGTELCVANKHRGSIKDIYTPLRCRLCFDKTNVLSDIVVGDAWGLRRDKEGFSAIIARTDKGRDVLLSAQKADALKLDTVNAEAVFKGQAIEKKRIDWTVFTIIRQDSGMPVPDFNFDKRWLGNTKGASRRSYREKIDWALYLANMTGKTEILKAAKHRVSRDKIRSFFTVRGFKRSVRNLWKKK
jgi:coenzyme F420 hydrogenase subunit beta